MSNDRMTNEVVGRNKSRRAGILAYCIDASHSPKVLVLWSIAFSSSLFNFDQLSPALRGVFSVAAILPADLRVVENPRVSLEGDKFRFQKHREIPEGDKFPPKRTRIGRGQRPEVGGQGNNKARSVKGHSELSSAR
jgi:hypothetical protein